MEIKEFEAIYYNQALTDEEKAKKIEELIKKDREHLDTVRRESGFDDFVKDYEEHPEKYADYMTVGEFLELADKAYSGNKTAQRKIDKISAGNHDIQELLRVYTSALALFSKKPVSVKTRRPDEFVAPTDNITRTVFTGIEPKVKTPVFVGDKNKQPVNVYVGINYDKLNGITIQSAQALTPYDQDVHDAILSLYLAGNEYITNRMIYQTMTGASPNDIAKASGISKKSLDEIDDAITKLMYSIIVIDASEEASAFGYEMFKYDSTVLAAERITAKLNGSAPVECLHLLRVPILYSYSDRKGQVSRVPISLLNTPGVKKTRENIQLQGYLLRRIEGMKNGHISNSILYETVFKYLGIEENVKSESALANKRVKIRDITKQILTDWKKDGHIIDFAEEKRGNTFYKIVITY